MKKVLFVYDEPNVLNGLRRMLRGLRDEWDMNFVGSGGKALEMMDQQPFDVIVSDIRMPQMDGAKLLTEVMKRHPKTVRIALSGHCDKETIMRAVKPAHQYLSKPCDPDLLKLTIGRACALQNLVDDEAIRELLSQIDSLPSLPSLYSQIVEELQSENSSIQKIGRIISKDPAMAAKVLKLVNSAFFGLSTHVADPDHAVKLLGLDTVKALVLTIEVFSQFENSILTRLQIDALWDHCLSTAALAKTLARAENQPKEFVEDAFMGGLLHDIGKLIFAANWTEKYKAVLTETESNGIALCDVEKKRLGASHAVVGAYLLGLWGLPETIIETVGYHHTPLACPKQQFAPLTIVHAANALSENFGSIGALPSKGLFTDDEYLTAIGMVDRLPEWQAIAENQ